MLSKSTLILAILAVIVTWLLISSIGQIETPASQGGGSGSLNGGNSGQESGSHSSWFSFPGFTLPFSFTLPSFSNVFNFNFPSFGFNFGTLNVNISYFSPVINGWNNIFHFVQPSGKPTLPGTPSPTSTSGSGIQHYIQVPTIILYLILALVATLFITGVVVSVIKREPNKKKEDEEGKNSLLLTADEQDTGGGITSYTFVTAEYPGWKQSDHFLQPEIAEVYPLVAGTGDDISVRFPPGTKIEEGTFVLSHLGSEKAVITAKEGCNRVEGKLDTSVDVLHIRGVRFNEEVIRLTEANIVSGRQDSLTVRELVNSQEMKDHIKDRKEVDQLVHLFELARYGGVEIDRDNFHSYLDRLRKSLRTPLVITCNGEN